MTIAGFNILSPERAVLWADTECFVDKTPARADVLKIAVNGLAGAVLASAGSLVLGRDAALDLCQFASFDAAVEKLPAMLRSGAEGFREIHPAAAAWSNSHLLVGWSHQRQRLAGVLFDDGFDYEPQFRRAATLPAVQSGDAICLHSVICTARDQLDALRRDYPLAEGGVLVLVEIGPDGVLVRPVYDFARAALLSKPPAFRDDARLTAAPGSS